MTIIAAIVIVIASLLGIVFTLLTLPGIWLAIGTALIWELFLPEPGLYHPNTLIAAVIMGLIAEGVEFAASAVGAAKAGGTRWGALGSILGGLVGALGGTFVIPIPVLGTLLGGALGAGAGALVAERHSGRMTWVESARVGGGAALGRLAATLIKTAFAAAIAVLLIVGALVA